MAPSNSGHMASERPERMSKLLDDLEQRRHLTADQREELEHRMKWMRESLEDAILSFQGVDERILLDSLMRVTGLPAASMAHADISSDAVDRVPARTAVGFHVMPLRWEQDALILAINRFPDPAEEDRLRVLLDCPVRFELATFREISESIGYFYGHGLSVFLELSGEDPSHPETSGSSPRGGDAGTGVREFVDSLLRDAVEMGATDIHFEPFGEDLRLRYRVDGVLQVIPLPRGVGTYRKAIISSLKVMAQLNVAEHRLPQDGRFSIDVGHRPYDVRMSILPSQYGETANLRILNRMPEQLGLNDLGLRDEQTDLFHRLLQHSNGMILCTGPTGSGKTTSLYTALKQLNQEDRKIITLEDPIEYKIHGITQMQVHGQIGFSFVSGLRSVLRHDPDVILVGEVRDTETASICISASMTGHLVLSTLHTNDAASAVTRLRDMGVEPYLIASSLQGVVAQRLVRRLCPVCREPHPAPPHVKRELEAYFPERTSFDSLYRARGCPECLFTGYRGRLALFEILEMTESLRALSAQDVSGARLRDAALEKGMTTLRQNGWTTALEGTTTVEEVLRVTDDIRRD